MGARIELPAPWGAVAAEWGGRGLRRVELLWRGPRASGGSGFPLEVARFLQRYLAGERCDPASLPVEVEGTAFQVAVWEEVRRIPYGAAVTYAEVARRLGRPGAARAVGRALGANPVALAVPCHRVVGADGLGGFGPGLGLKEVLLRMEGALR